MKKTLTSALETFARLIPLSVYPRLVRRDLIDFFYHAVSDNPMPHVRQLYPVVPVADFEAALLYLKTNCTFVDYAQVQAYVFGGVPLPPKAVHLSFDDGYAECFSVVCPLLLKHQIPCTFFLTTSLIDNQILFYRNKQSLCVERVKDPSFKLPLSSLNDFLPANHAPFSTLDEFIAWFKDLRLSDGPLIDEICRALGVDWQAFLSETQPYLTTAQIRQMHAEGFTLGSHTLTHRKLMDLPAAEIETEIADSCQIVAEITGQVGVPFSFPHSAWGLDRGLLADIRARHPEIGLLFDTKGLHGDVKFIHNRIWAERRGARALSEHLREAYQETWVEEILGLGRRLRS
ncbi:MAG TPA: hypothetical protein DEH25_18010 [Chloroflexi bacterium]|nr:hypothetical protein [Chloroflexota bacterium]